MQSIAASSLYEPLASSHTRSLSLRPKPMSFVSGRAKALMLRRCKNTTLIKVDVCLAAFAKEFPGFFPLGSFSVIYLFPASPQIKSSFWQSWSTLRPRRDGRGGGVGPLHHMDPILRAREAGVVLSSGRRSRWGFISVLMRPESGCFDDRRWMLLFSTTGSSTAYRQCRRILLLEIINGAPHAAGCPPT